MSTTILSKLLSALASLSLLLTQVSSQLPIQHVSATQVMTVGEAQGLGLSSTNSNLFGATGIIPKTAAFFETYMTAPIQTTDTSFTMASNLTTAGVALSNGYYSFILDQGTPQQEIVEGTASGTSVTGLVRGIDPQNPNATSSAVTFQHARGADIKITDYTFIGHVSNILSGTDTLPNILSYTTTATSGITLANQIPNKAYVDSVAVAGASNADTVTRGIVQLATAAQLGNGTATGSTGAALVAASTNFSSSSSATTLVPVTGSNGKLSQGFTDYTLNNTWSGLNTFSSSTSFTSTNTFSVATTTFSGNTTFSLLPTATTTTPTQSGQLVTQGYVSGLAFWSPQSGVTTHDVSANGTQTIAHGLGRVPRFVRFTVLLAGGLNQGGSGESFGTYTATSQQASYMFPASPPQGFTTSTQAIVIGLTASAYNTGVISVDATNITITWNKASTPTGTAEILWEAY